MKHLKEKVLVTLALFGMLLMTLIWTLIVLVTLPITIIILSFYDSKTFFKLMAKINDNIPKVPDIKE